MFQFPILISGTFILVSATVTVKLAETSLSDEDVQRKRQIYDAGSVDIRDQGCSIST